MPFQESKTIDEAHARREALGGECQRLQAELGSKNRVVNGRRLTAVEFWRWHGEAKLVLQDKVAELQAIKDWIRTFRRSAHRAFQAESEGLFKTVAAAKTSFDALLGLMDAMRDRLRMLTDENEALHRRLQALENEHAERNDPSSGGKREEWRMDENFDRVGEDKR